MTGLSFEARWADFNALCNARVSTESGPTITRSVVLVHVRPSRLRLDLPGVEPAHPSAAEIASNSHAAVTNCAPLPKAIARILDVAHEEPRSALKKTVHP